MNTCWAFCHWLACVQTWLNFHSCAQDTAVTSALRLLIEISSKHFFLRSSNVSAAWNSCSVNKFQLRYEDGVTVLGISIIFSFLITSLLQIDLGVTGKWQVQGGGTFCGVHCFTVSYTSGCTRKNNYRYHLQSSQKYIFSSYLADSSAKLTMALYICGTHEHCVLSQK